MPSLLLQLWTIICDQTEVVFPVFLTGGLRPHFLSPELFAIVFSDSMQIIGQLFWKIIQENKNYL